ncbi:MAG: spermidine synthase [Candidatus Omnitrophica bacterium]|nr:spermidine synthase [Candidatus Omnitrophota bacterium]
MFETTWQRMMFLVFGASAPATSAIFTALFCGIAFGSLIGGRILNRFRNPWVFYALVECWIGIWGLSVPKLIPFADYLQLILFRNLMPGDSLFFLCRFFLAVLVVLPATLGMGATIPAMNRILTRYRSVGLGISTAYGVNTIGSVSGCLLTGIFLFSWFGISRSLFATASINFLVAACALAWFISQRNKTELEDDIITPQISGEDHSPPLQRNEKFLLGIYFVTGMLALGYEIVWFRLMGLATINTIITFTMGLSFYLMGFALGSLILFPILTRRWKSEPIYILANWGTAISTLCLIPLYYYFFNLKNIQFLDNMFDALDWNFLSRQVFEEGFYAFIIMFIPPIFMGLAYPAICDLLINNKKQAALKSGSIYFIGSLGSALGVILVGLFIIPAIDIVATLSLMCIIGLILVLLTMQYMPDYRQGKNGAVFKWSSVICIIIALVYSCFGMPFMRGGTKLIKKDNMWVYARTGPEYNVPLHLLLRYKSGASGNISVDQFIGEGENYKRLLIDGQRVASTRMKPKVDAKMLAHVPLLIHQDPKNALTVGFGSGGTSWSMTRYGIQVDCAEIEPEVIRSAHLFEDQNYSVVHEPNYRIILNDVRNYLHLTTKKYDTISTDVTNLQYKQSSNLYTREYFQLLKDHLTPTGITSAWIPMRWCNIIDFRILLKSFQDVYPHTSIWYFDSYYVILIGTPEPLNIDYNRLQSMFNNPAVRDDLAEIDVYTIGQFLEFFVVDEDGVREFAGQVPMHTDDYPILEFRGAPHLYYGRMVTKDDLKQVLVKDRNKYIENKK